MASFAPFHYRNRADSTPPAPVASNIRMGPLSSTGQTNDINDQHTDDEFDNPQSEGETQTHNSDLNGLDNADDLLAKLSQYETPSKSRKANKKEEEEEHPTEPESSDSIAEQLQRQLEQLQSQNKNGDSNSSKSSSTGNSIRNSNGSKDVEQESNTKPPSSSTSLEQLLQQMTLLTNVSRLLSII